MEKTKRVALFTLGCKLNFSETSTIARKFTDFGYEKVDFNDQADVYVINTCSVTDIADKKCRNAIQKAIKQSPEAQVIVVGCYAQLSPEILNAIEGVDLVLSNQDKDNIVELVELGRKGYSSCDFKELKEFSSACSIDDRTRSFLKIQDGCDYFCSYCTIPKARGLSRSDSIKNVIDKTQYIVSKGIKEIVLTGVNTGDFGRKNGESLYELLTNLHKVKGLDRLRISSIEPNLLDNNIINLASQSSLIMPHFHIPLQCGVDKLLVSMHRRYTTDFFRERVNYIRQLIPQAYIAIDIIVGVPGESDDDFNHTMEFLKSMNLSELHIFTYSERPDTEAIKMEQVPKNIRRKRSHLLHNFAKEINSYFCTGFENSTRPVLFERGRSTKIMEGFTDNYLKVAVAHNESMVNKIAMVKLGSYDSNRQLFSGKIIEL